MDIPGAKMGNLSLTGVMGATTKEHGAQLVEDLLQLGIAISSEGELAPVLERIVTQARRFTGAEAATLFLREGAHLRFAVVQNDISATAGGTLIALDPTHSITLNGVAPASLTAANFTFV